MKRRQFLATGAAALLVPQVQAAAGARARVIVSSDIGGTDPDDFQSMVHLLLCADRLDLEGIISSPFGQGEKKHILEVIDRYAQDYPNLRTWSDAYPTPDRLRGLSKQGAVDTLGYQGFGTPSEGSQWLIDCARRPDPRPLHLQVWGGIDDLAQALHDAPDILPKLRVYFIGGPNKKWSADAYQYIADHHSTLWIIEANSTYRGWFVGGDQSGDQDNTAFVATHVAGHGALGDYFATHLAGTIKMGDSPAVGWILSGHPSDPTKDGWGGRFVRAWDRPYRRFDRLTTVDDRIERFGVVEWRLPLNTSGATAPTATLIFENQSLPGYWDGRAMRFRVSPKDARLNTFRFVSDHPELNGRGGAFTSFAPPPENATKPSARYPNWWTDDPDPAFADGEHQGTRTVNRWRKDILADFARLMDRCARPKPA